MFRLFFIIIFLAGIAHDSYSAYKCGNTYSQTPCAPDAKKLYIPSSPLSGDTPVPKTSAAQIEQNVKICERALREVPSWKDRESLKLSPIKRLPKTMVVDIQGQKREIILYTSHINGKNSYGAYQGEKIAACYFDLTDEKFLDYFIGS